MDCDAVQSELGSGSEDEPLSPLTPRSLAFGLLRGAKSAHETGTIRSLSFRDSELWRDDPRRRPLLPGQARRQSAGGELLRDPGAAAGVRDGGGAAGQRPGSVSNTAIPYTPSTSSCPAAPRAPSCCTAAMAPPPGRRSCCANPWCARCTSPRTTPSAAEVSQHQRLGSTSCKKQETQVLDNLPGPHHPLLCFQVPATTSHTFRRSHANQ